MTDMSNDFYEDDEPVEKISAAFIKGEKHLTKAPVNGRNAYVALPGLAMAPASDNHPTGELVTR